MIPAQLWHRKVCWSCAESQWRARSSQWSYSNRNLLCASVSLMVSKVPSHQCHCHDFILPVPATTPAKNHVWRVKPLESLLLGSPGVAATLVVVLLLFESLWSLSQCRFLPRQGRVRTVLSHVLSGVSCEEHQHLWSRPIPWSSVECEVMLVKTWVLFLGYDCFPCAWIPSVWTALPDKVLEYEGGLSFFLFSLPITCCI